MKIKTDELTPQQAAFVAEVIQRGFKKPNEAYMAAYPNCKRSAADSCASRLLKNGKIKKQIEVGLQELLNHKKAFLEHEIFNFWYVRMTYDPTEIIDLDGNLIMTTEELRKRGLHVVIDSVNKKKTKFGDQVEYELADRDHAADKLNEYIQMIKPQPVNLELTGKDGSPIQTQPIDANLSEEFAKLRESAERRLKASPSKGAKK